MKTYIPKILITKQPATGKFGFEDEYGELSLFIENDLSEVADEPEDLAETIYK